MYQKFCFSNPPLTFWSLVFHCLSIFEMCYLKLVSRAFEELVNYNIKFKRIIDLTNDMCDEILWRKKVKVLEFKQSVLMFQLYGQI